MIAGFDLPTEGEILLNGEPITARTNLLHFPLCHDYNLIRHSKGLLLVMGYIDKGNPKLFMHLLKFKLHLFSVESGKNEIVAQSVNCAIVGEHVGVNVEPDNIHIMIAEDHTNIFAVMVTLIDKIADIALNTSVLRQ